jgi:hypothetical protein
MILELATCEPRILRFKIIYAEVLPWRPEIVYPKVFSVPGGIPPMFHVNYESRERAKEIYEIVNQTIWTQHTKSSFAINPAADILCLEDGLEPGPFEMLLEHYPVMGTLKHLALKGTHPVGCPGSGLDFIPDCFPNLEQITIIHDIWRLRGDDYLSQVGREQRGKWIDSLKRIWREKYGRELSAKISIINHKSSLTSDQTVFHELKLDSCYMKQLEEIASLYPKYC